MLLSDQSQQVNLARFARLVARPEPAVDLAVGALCAAAANRPGLDFEPSLIELEDLAERVRDRLELGDGLATVLERLHALLYGAGGFRAPEPEGLLDPRNSELDAVLDRRVGLPLSLSIVELEVGWRLGLPLHGVGLPGHFLVGGPGGLVLDPADGGRVLTPDDCQAILRRTFGEHILFNVVMLRPVGRREMLARLLRNLRGAYLGRREWLAAYRIVELLATVEPTTAEHGRDRGVLLGRLGRFSGAIVSLGHYLDERPNAPDADDVRRVMAIFRGRRN